jgi:hypothetical protein
MTQEQRLQDELRGRVEHVVGHPRFWWMHRAAMAETLREIADSLEKADEEDE